MRMHAMIGQLRDLSHAHNATVMNAPHHFKQRAATLEYSNVTTANESERAALSASAATRHRTIEKRNSFLTSIGRQFLTVNVEKRCS